MEGNVITAYRVTYVLYRYFPKKLTTMKGTVVLCSHKYSIATVSENKGITKI
jgi:hypothetical protein